MAITYNGTTLTGLKFNNTTCDQVATISGTTCVATFFVPYTVRDGYFCSRASGSYQVGDTHWQYTYQYSYDNTNWTDIAANSTAKDFTFTVATGTKSVYLRKVQVNTQTYSSYQAPNGTYTSHPYGSLQVYARNDSNGNYPQTATVNYGSSVTISNSKVVFKYIYYVSNYAIDITNNGTVTKYYMITNTSTGASATGTLSSGGSTTAVIREGLTYYRTANQSTYYRWQ